MWVHFDSQRFLSHNITFRKSILDMSKVEAGRLLGRFQPVHLDQVVSDLAALFRSIAEKKGIEFEVLNSKEDQLLVYVDIGELIPSRIISAANELATSRFVGKDHVQLVRTATLNLSYLS